jgi:uncharacterized protein
MPRARAAAWLGAVARIVAFAGLFLALAVVFDAAWRLLAARFTGGVLHGGVVMALAATVAGALLIRGLDGRSPAALGLGVSRMTARHWMVGTAVGAAGLVVAALVMFATGALRYAPQAGDGADWLQVVAAQLGIFAVAAYAEEVLFRGYAFQVLARTAGPVAAALTTSLLFALAHANNPSVGVLALANIFLAGLLLAAAYVRTLSLWFATAVHVGWNWAMASLFDLPVSGLTGFDTPLYEPAIGEPAWWSGGTFGPEGGLVGSLGFAVALVLILRWRAVQPDPAIAAARPLILNREEALHDG